MRFDWRQKLAAPPLALALAVSSNPFWEAAASPDVGSRRIRLIRDIPALWVETVFTVPSSVKHLFPSDSSTYLCYFLHVWDVLLDSPWSFYCCRTTCQMRHPCNLKRARHKLACTS